MESKSTIDLTKAHEVPLKRLISNLESDDKGLSEEEVVSRRGLYGTNQLTEKKDLPIILKFLLQFNNFFSYLLLFGAGLSFMSENILPGEGSIFIAWALVGVTILNAVFTFIQEYKAEQAMKSFKKLMISQVVVLRNGQRHQISSTELVPGDIIILSEGDKITADARIIEVANLKVDHSALTGESEPQLRSLKTTSKNILLSRNMVFSGTLVQSGSGKAIIVATGDDTQIGKIAQATQEVEVQASHLQLQIAHFIKIISYIAIFLGISFFLFGVFITKNPFWANMVFAIGIIVANVPEGLLPTVTLTLSIAAQRMAKKNVLIKNMDAIETLGSLTVICSDKTGTLTENNLHVHGFYMNNKFYTFDREQDKILEGKKEIRTRNINGLRDFNDILVLCNNSTFTKDRSFGDPTEICLKSFVSKFSNLEYIEKAHPRSLEIPFSSETKYMITTNRFNSNERAYLKGAPEVMIDKCNTILIDGKVKKLTSTHKRKILKDDEEYAKKGFRVLGCALKQDKKFNEKVIDKDDYTFYGFIVMQDPPRTEVPKAVSLCQEAGIKIIVISGDQATTVENIARQVGIIKDKDPVVLTGPELSKYSDDQLKEILTKPEIIFARSLPRDKLRIVSLLKDMGEIVAVTGDGVNDAPALKKAHVGVAMGKIGTEVAKEAADAVLLDDNFASIVHAIESGRTVYDNIKAFITYILTSNTPEIIPFLVFVLFGWPLALPVLLILAIDLGTDMLPAIGLGVEPATDEIMKRPPRDPKSKLLNWKMIARSYGFIGPLQTLFAYIIFFKILFTGGWTWGTDLAITSPIYMSAVTGFFATIIVVQMFNVFACRTTRASVFTKGLLKNKIILLGLLSEGLLLALLTLNPLLQKVFGTAPFPLTLLGWMFGFGAIVLILEELRKYIYRTTGRFGVD
ncbi:cation-translocating P-type ATPase [Nanoarchaeota archaeon]